MIIGLGILGVCVAFLFLLVLSLMREVVLWRGEVDAISTLIKHPPQPPFIGSAAPAPLIEALSRVQPAIAVSSRIVAFVAPECAGCEHFVRQSHAAIAEGRVRRDDFVFILYGDEEEQRRRRFRAFVDDLPGRSIIDEAGRLGSVCEVRATPSVFVISSTNDAVAFDMKGNIEWALSHLAEGAGTTQDRPQLQAAGVAS